MTAALLLFHTGCEQGNKTPPIQTTFISFQKKVINDVSLDTGTTELCIGTLVFRAIALSYDSIQLTPEQEITVRWSGENGVKEATAHLSQSIFGDSVDALTVFIRSDDTVFVSEDPIDGAIPEEKDLPH